MGELVFHAVFQQDVRGFAQVFRIRDQRFIEALPDVSGAAAANGRLSVQSDIDVAEPLFPGLGRRLFQRQKMGPAGPEGIATCLQGTAEAVRMLRRTLEGSEIHHALVEGRSVLFRQQFVCQEGEFLFGLRSAHRSGDAEMAGQYAVHIAVHNGGGDAEADGSDGCRRIVSHSFEGTDTLQGVRKGAPGDNLPGGRVKVPGAGIVSETLPEAQDFVFAGFGQVLNGREALHETLPIGRPLRDSGLLEDDFAEPDGIRVLRTAPGKIPGVFCIPVQNPL